MVERVRGITRYGYVIKNSGDFVLISSIEMAFELSHAHTSLDMKNEALLEANRKLLESDRMQQLALSAGKIGTL